HPRCRQPAPDPSAPASARARGGVHPPAPVPGAEHGADPSPQDVYNPSVTRARPDLPLMLALTFSTGVIDAVGYLGFDRVFSGNMTGNVVLLGMGIAGADGLPVVR